METISVPESRGFLSREWHNPAYAKNSQKQTPQLRSDLTSTRVESLFSEGCFE